MTFFIHEKDSSNKGRLNKWFLKIGKQQIRCQPIKDVILHHKNSQPTAQKILRIFFVLIRVMLTYRFGGLILPHNTYTSESLVL